MNSYRKAAAAYANGDIKVIQFRYLFKEAENNSLENILCQIYSIRIFINYLLKKENKRKKK